MDTTFKKEKLGEKIKWSKIRVIFISDWEQMKNDRKINGLNITKFGRNKQTNKQKPQEIQEFLENTNISRIKLAKITLKHGQNARNCR